MDEKISNFLEDLAVLTTKYGIKIKACGCYPSLQTLDGEGLRHGLEFDGEKYEADPL